MRQSALCRVLQRAATIPARRRLRVALPAFPERLPVATAVFRAKESLPYPNLQVIVMKIPALALVLAALVASPAQALDAPSGWQRQNQDGLTIFMPADVGSRVFMVMLTDPLPMGGKTLQDWGPGMADHLSASYGQVTGRDSPRSESSLWSITHQIKPAQGSTDLFALYTMYPAGNDRARVALMIGEAAPELLQRYGEASTTLIANAMRETGTEPSSPPAQVATTAPGPSSNGATRQSGSSNKDFPWTTAPGQGLSLSQIETITHSLEQVNDSRGIYLDEEHVLLLKDGTAYTNLRVPPEDLDVAASRRNEPEKWTRWRKQGKDYQLERNGQWRDSDGTATVPARSGERLDGSYTASASYGSMYTTSHTFKDTLFFGADGSYSTNSSVRGGTGTLNNLADNSMRGNADALGQNQGSYHLDGYTLERRYADGRVERTLFFFWNHKKERIYIKNRTYTRK